MNDSEKVRITVTVDRAASEKIAELAQRMGASHSKMASMLLEAGLSDHAWIIKIVTSKIVKGLTQALGYELKSSEDAISNELKFLQEDNDAKGFAEPTMDRAIG
jgi:hypothetical protein